MKLRYAAVALRQIDEALAYVEARSPQGAAGLRERILSAVALIRDHPFSAQATNRQNTRRVVLMPYPYVLFYRVSAQSLVVTRLRHAARRPDASAERV